MKKLLFLIPLICTILLNCSKDRVVTSTPSVEGSWNLKSMSYNYSLHLEEDTLGSRNYSEGYIILGENNKLKTNLAISSFIYGDIFDLTQTYSSDYKIEGNMLTLEIKNHETDRFIPFTAKIVKENENDLQLVSTERELLQTAKELDVASGGTSNEAFFNVLVKSIEIKLHLSK